MIPVKEALATGAWLHFCSDDETIQFRLRAISFRKLDLSEVDNPLEIENLYGNADWWIMRVELVSLVRKRTRPITLTERITLVDQDDFEFSVTYDSHLCTSSDFSETSGLHRLTHTDLIPKTKSTGAIAFVLPDDENAEYYLSMVDGSVQEA